MPWTFDMSKIQNGNYTLYININIEEKRYEDCMEDLWLTLGS